MQTKNRALVNNSAKEKIFREGTPNGCPGKESREASGTFFRACKAVPPTDEDFTSHAHSKLRWKQKRADRSKCSHWGLSGWININDVKHARNMHEWLQDYYIVSVELTPDDGRIAQTGEVPHHTYWPFDGVNLPARSKLVKL